MTFLETIFTVVNIWVLPGWLLLILARSWKYTSIIVCYLVVLVMAVTYTVLFFSNINTFDPEAGSSLNNLTQAFGNPQATLLGWVHYLAFDMLAGLVVAMDGRKLGINPVLMVIPLFFTLMTGPFGLLIYLIIRLIKVRRPGVPLID